MKHNRLTKNVRGDFYATGECLACDLPESEAPNLISKLTDENYDTYFVKEPITPKEISEACDAIEICCVNALRYGGKNKDIINRLYLEVCDYKINKNGEVVENKS